MVAGPVYTEPITQEMLFAWFCETCQIPARTERIMRNPMDRTTRFVVFCPDGTLTNVDVADRALEIRRGERSLRFRHQRREPQPPANVTATSNRYSMAEPITDEEMRYRWHCVTCNKQGRLLEIHRDPETAMTRFTIWCSNGVAGWVEMTHEYRSQRPHELFFHHHDGRFAIAENQAPPRREPSPQNGDIQIRCLSGCGEVINSVVLTDHARDGRNITPGCRGPRFSFFVSEQLWRSGISRISYRHDGNYVIFDRDMKLVAEGREESPEWPQAGFEPELESEYARRMASALYSEVTVNSTSSVTFQMPDFQRHLELLRESNMQHQREAEARRRRRNERTQMTEADREREEIWREYQMGIAARPQEELTLTYNDLVRAMNSVEALASSPKPAKPLEPRRRRAVIRRALEKK